MYPWNGCIYGMVYVCLSMVFFSVWSSLSSNVTKAKKIEIVMIQIKSTKRLTIDNFQEISKHIIDFKRITLRRVGGEKKCFRRNAFEQKSNQAHIWLLVLYSFGLLECSK